jgi:flavin-dependent dehydrogenase
MYDVVIIGGGYSGSLLDSLLDGLDTILVEKKEIGSKNVSAVTFMKIVGFEDAIVKTYDSYTLMTVDRDFEVYRFGEDVFCLVDYGRLCKNLVRSDVVREKVVGYGPGKVELEDEVIKAKVIVDCSGIGGENLRRKAGFKLPPVVNALKFERVSSVEWIDPSSFYLIVGFANFGGWIYPIDNNFLEFGMADRFRKREEISFPKIEEARKLFGFEKDSESRSALYPYGFVKKVVKDNMVIFGDASGLTHPVYGMSLHYIYKMAPKLADVIKKTVQGKSKLNEYQRIWRETLRKASSLIAGGYSTWDLPLDTQIKLTKLQMKLKVSSDSILSQMWALDEKFEVYAKHSPKLTDYPISLHFKNLINRIRIIL